MPSQIGVHPAGIENARRIEGGLEAAGQPLDGGLSGWNTSTAARTFGSARISMACPPWMAMTRRISAVPASAVAGTSSQMRPPDQS